MYADLALVNSEVFIVDQHVSLALQNTRNTSALDLKTRKTINKGVRRCWVEKKTIIQVMTFIRF